jgi:hypothetical protein
MKKSLRHQLDSDEVYLEELRYELRTLPDPYRSTCVEDIRQHIIEANLVGNVSSRGDIVERLGSPRDLAAKFLVDPPTELIRKWDLWAPWLLVLGGVFGGVGWALGMYAIWTSRRWSLFDRIAGSVIFPAWIVLACLAKGGADSIGCRTSGVNGFCQPAGYSILEIALLAFIVTEFIRLEWRLFRVHEYLQN